MPAPSASPPAPPVAVANPPAPPLPPFPPPELSPPSPPSPPAPAVAVAPPAVPPAAPAGSPASRRAYPVARGDRAVGDREGRDRDGARIDLEDPAGVIAGDGQDPRSGTSYLEVAGDLELAGRELDGSGEAVREHD